MFADPAAVKATADRIKTNTDHGSVTQHPDFDAQQFQLAMGEAVQSRDFDPFRRVFEFHGFRYSGPVERGKRELAAMNRGQVLEGQWRHAKLGMAFTVSDVFSLYTKPEDLDKWIRDQKLVKMLERANASKSETRIARSRL